jgi:transcriptional regulator with XRE-family HTH domain
LNDPHAELLQAFKRVYQSSGLSGKRFARKINISQQQWSAVLRGDRNIGEDLITAMIQEYSEVGPDVLRYFMTRKTPRKPQTQFVETNS